MLQIIVPYSINNCRLQSQSPDIQVKMAYRMCKQSSKYLTLVYIIQNTDAQEIYFVG